MELVEIEAQLKKVELVRKIEHAVAQLDASVKHHALVSAIRAEDAAESERSIVFDFDHEESTAMFRAAAELLYARRDRLMSELQ